MPIKGVLVYPYFSLRQSNIRMPETSLSLKCHGHTKRDDGLVSRYYLEVTDTRSGKTATISVEPRHLASARSMKRILLGQCMLYTATRAEHDQMLLDVLDPQPESIHEQSGWPYCSEVPHTKTIES